jgi:hypothetical protein
MAGGSGGAAGSGGGAGGGTGGSSAGAGGGGATGTGGGGGATAGTGGGGGSAGGGSAGTGGAAGHGGSGGATAGAGGATAGSGGGGTTGAGGAAGRGGSGGSAAGTGGATAGTGGGGATCDGTAPCGGNLVGTWNFISVCLNQMALMEGFKIDNCPEATLSDATATRTGSVIFTTTDYAVAGTLTVSYTLTMPASCIDSGASCSDFGDSLVSANIQSAYCTGDTICVCPIVTAPISNSESGTYTTAGSTLSTTPASGTPATSSYCVQGDKLHVLNVETITDMGVARMRTRSDQVAQRQ